MNSLRAQEHNQSTKEEILYLNLILSHINERLSILTPGINCTINQHKTLLDNRVDLTLRLKAAKLRSRGYTFVEENDTIYACGDIILKLVGIYEQKLRA